MLILDLETDGLLPDVTKIHCAVTYDTVTKECNNYICDNVFDAMSQNVGSPVKGTYALRDLPDALDKTSQLCCHNGIGFDLRVLRVILNYEYKGVYIDTFLLSRILFPDIEAPENDHGSRSRHSVESWGIRFGHPKVKHDDWSKFSMEMLHRCVEDTKIQGQIYEHCHKTMQELVARDSRFQNMEWMKVIRMEQKVWNLIDDQAEHGWTFDLERAYTLIDTLTHTIASVNIKLSPILPPKVTHTETVTKAFKADGELTVNAANWCLSDEVIFPSGDFCKLKREPFNLHSSAQVKDYLLSKGWEPKEYNFKKDKHGKPLRDDKRQLIKTSPKVPKTAEDWAEVAEELGSPDIALLSEYNKASHRLSQIEGLIKNVRQDHRIEAHANTCATNTARMAHRVVVNIPKADPSIYFGKELRSLFKASEGLVLVGCDASALEARCEAHYIHQYDPVMANVLINGDIHSVNADVFGVDRNTAKTGKYAILYGCSPQKLASTLKLPLGQAKSLYENYWEANTASKALKEALEEEYEQFGYIKAIDGRPLTIRYKHAILNTLLQSCGSIAIKVALCIFHRRLIDTNLQAHMLGVFHDEWQTECHPSIADRVGLIAVESIREAGRYLGMNVPLDGEYKIGLNWAETH